MIYFFKVNIKDKHDFIMLNKDDGKWFSKINDKLTWIDRTLSSLNLKPVNSRMGFKEQQKKTSGLANEVLYSDQQSYLEAKAKAYKAEQAYRKTINYLQHFSSALLGRKSKVFKPLTTIQNKSLEQKKYCKTVKKSKRSNYRSIKSI